jgi:segregation and condensation protein B
MLNDDILKALIEGIIYVAPEPVALESILKVLEGEECERVKAKLEELVADYEQTPHGIQIRQVANGYKFSTKAEHHEVLRKYVKSLRPPVRLSKPALETLAVVAYRQPVTMPEIEEIRGVDSGGVIHTLLEKKLVVTSGRKNVVGRPILYRTSREFLMHFGLKNVGELPSLKEFEELAKRALGSDWNEGEAPAPSTEAAPTSSADAGTPAAEAGPAPPQELSAQATEEATPAQSEAVITEAASSESAPEPAEAEGLAIEAARAPAQNPDSSSVEDIAQMESPAREAIPFDSPSTEPAAPSEEATTIAAEEETSSSDSETTSDGHEPQA